MLSSALIGTGSYVPEKILTNFDLEKMVDTSDEWIRRRTGMVERHIVDGDTASSDLGIQASLKAIEVAGINPEEIDMVRDIMRETGALKYSEKKAEEFVKIAKTSLEEAEPPLEKKAVNWLTELVNFVIERAY